MKLWSSGEIDADVADSFREARKWVEAAINQLLSANDYGDGLDEWAFIAMINRPHIHGYKEVAKLARNKREAEFRLRVSHDEFLAGGEAERKRLLLSALLRSITLMPTIGVADIDMDRLSADVGALAQEVDKK